MRNSIILLLRPSQLGILLCFFLLPTACATLRRPTQGPPGFTIRPAPELTFPGAPPNNLTDCNSPGHWDGKTLYIFNSWGMPARSAGPDLLHLTERQIPVKYNNDIGSGRWLECTYQHNGVLYGWYHNEPPPVCATGQKAPRIGAVRSRDNGLTWEDLGIVLSGRADGLHGKSKNNYFAGGHGDFCAIADRHNKHVYLYFSTYAGETPEQGVALARVAVTDLDRPVGKVRKWHAGRWTEPGVGGRVTPVLPVRADWHGLAPDAFWGPSIHYNTHLRQYVMLINRAVDPTWKQDGIYVSFNPDAGDPSGWSEPRRLPLTLDGPIHLQFYPQVFGTDAARRETDKLAGRTARLFVAGHSKWEITFLRPGERP